MSRFILTIIMLVIVCGCKTTKTNKKATSLKPDSSAPVWVSMGGSYQGIGLSLTGKVTTFAGGKTELGSVDGAVLSARFDNPDTMTINNGYIYITDGGNSGIRKINISTGVVTTILKNTTAAGQLWGITTFGNYLYVFDTFSYSILKINIGTEEVSTLAGSGAAGSNDGVGSGASFNGQGSSITTDGKALYMLEPTGLRKVEIATGHVSTADSGNLSSLYPDFQSLTTDGIYLYILTGSFVYKVSLDDFSARLTYIGTSSGKICFDGKYLYFSKNGSVRRVPLSPENDDFLSGPIEILAGDEDRYDYRDGKGMDVWFGTLGSMVSDGKKLYVSDFENHVIRLIE